MIPRADLADQNTKQHDQAMVPGFQIYSPSSPGLIYRPDIANQTLMQIQLRSGVILEFFMLPHPMRMFKGWCTIQELKDILASLDRLSRDYCSNVDKRRIQKNAGCEARRGNSRAYPDMEKTAHDG